MTPSLKVSSSSPEMSHIVSPDKGETREEKIRLAILQVIDIREIYKDQPGLYVGPPTPETLVDIARGNLKENHKIEVTEEETYRVLEEMMRDEESDTDSPA